MKQYFIFIVLFFHLAVLNASEKKVVDLLANGLTDWKTNTSFVVNEKGELRSEQTPSLTYQIAFPLNCKINFEMWDRTERGLHVSFTKPNETGYFGLDISRTHTTPYFGARHFPTGGLSNGDLAKEPLTYHKIEILFKTKREVEASLDINGSEVFEEDIAKGNFVDDEIWITIEPSEFVIIKNFTVEYENNTKASVTSVTYDNNQLEQLKKGSDNWNRWREANPHEKINLEGADLGKADLSNANLESANLKNCNLKEAKFEKANLVGADLSGSNLENATLVGVVANEAKFDHTQLINVNCYTGLFYRASFVGANMTKLDAVHAIFIRADFTNANLQDASLYMGHCMAIMAEGCNFENTNTFYCNLAGLRFGKNRIQEHLDKNVEKITIGWSHFPIIRYDKKQYELLKSGTDAWNNWRKENNKVTINLEGADLSGWNLDGMDLNKAQMQGVELGGASLKGTNLEKANLVGANLQKANFEGANLNSTNLEGADLNEAQLKDASIKNTALFGANLKWMGTSGLDSSDLKKAIKQRGPR